MDTGLAVAIAQPAVSLPIVATLVAGMSSLAMLLQRTLVVERATAMDLKFPFWNEIQMGGMLKDALVEQGFTVDGGLVTFPPTVESLRRGGRATVATAIDTEKGLVLGQLVASRDFSSEIRDDADSYVQERILREAHQECEHEAVGALMDEVHARLSPAPGSPLEKAYRAANQAALAKITARAKKTAAPKKEVVEEALRASFPIYRGPAGEKGYERDRDEWPWSAAPAGPTRAPRKK